ncbi:MAG TPA: hypothetical protein VJ756_14685 [Terriglobales bacterium]|nr:hypothetical protein [Terriglobales bacterium]
MRPGDTFAINVSPPNFSYANVLLNLGKPGGFDITPWAESCPVDGGKISRTWKLPTIGPVMAPAAVLVRPDGYVAWLGDVTQAGLADALTTWFGPPTSV